MEPLVQQQEFPLVRDVVCPVTLLHQSEHGGAVVGLPEEQEEFLGGHGGADQGRDQLNHLQGLAVQIRVVDVSGPDQELALLSLRLFA